jgi:hypothetical protein
MKVEFEGIDTFNRPIFKEAGVKKRGARRFGSLRKLFDYGTTKEEVLKEVRSDDLLFFGSSFGCEPAGCPCEVEII